VKILALPLVKNISPTLSGAGKWYVYSNPLVLRCGSPFCGFPQNGHINERPLNLAWAIAFPQCLHLIVILLQKLD